MDKTRYPLLLTGTIDPGNVKKIRVEQRLGEYEHAIERYINMTPFNPIVFAENSGYPFNAKKYEKMAEKQGKIFEYVQGSFCAEEVKNRGKGYGEGLLIYEGLKKSILNKEELFYKMTGRIFLKNSEAIIRTRNRHKNEFIIYDGMGWCMTWCFKANVEDYMKVLGDIYKECDDKKLRDIEICMWLRLQKADLDVGSFSEYPNIDGKMGDTQIAYTKSWLDWAIRNAMIKLGIFTMNSKMSSIFWKIYQIVTGRKPYVINNI